MDADEKAIIDYLKSWSEQFVSGKEICRRAGGKWRFREDPEWAGPVLTRLVERGHIESDSTGHYRLVRSSKEKKDKKWVSPQMRKILEQSGKDFGEVLSPEEQDDFYTDK
jgi:hypothetical protein